MAIYIASYMHTEDRRPWLQPPSNQIAQKLLLAIYIFWVRSLAFLLRGWPNLFPKKLAWFAREASKSRRTRGLQQDWVWLHAASGEVERLRPLLPQLRARFPHLQLVLTLTSSSLMERARQFPELDEVLVLPLDTPNHLAEFCAGRWPRLLVVAQSDWWPSLLHTLSRNLVPIIVVGYSVNSSEDNLSWPRRKFFAWATRQMSLLTTIEALPPLLQATAQCQVVTSGDPRWDQVFRRQEDSSAELFRPHENLSALTGVLASTWPEDERELFPLIEKFPFVRWIWAPHEPTAEALAKIETELAIFGLPVLRLSTLNQRSWNNEVLVIDRTGVLFEAFAIANFAFVGGSFRRRVHSVMEPLSQGLVTFVGPFHANSPEALQFQQSAAHSPLAYEKTPVVACRSGAELELQLQTLLASQPKQEQWLKLKLQIRQRLQDQRGATDRVILACAKFLDQVPPISKEELHSKDRR